MNQRQKKKVSQGKKRYHEAIKKQETHTKVTPHSQKPGESRSVKPPVGDASPHPETRSGQPVKSYSKRKIASNWSRYQEGRNYDVVRH